jgi:hypothetical protein
VLSRFGSTSSHERSAGTRRVQRVERAVLPPHPLAEARAGVRAEAELGVRDVGGVRPVDDVRLAPEVDADEGAALGEALGERAVEGPVGLAHRGVIEAVARRRLGIDGLPVRRHEPRVGVRFAHPSGGRVHVDLHDDLQAELLGQSDDHVERVEPVRAGSRLARRPVDPRAHGVEPELADLLEVLAPGRSCGSREHRGSRGAAAVPCEGGPAVALSSTSGRASARVRGRSGSRTHEPRNAPPPYQTAIRSLRSPPRGVTERDARDITAFLATLRAESTAMRMIRGYAERALGRHLPEPWMPPSDEAAEP